MKRIRISSSIANFADKLRNRYKDYGDFRWFSTDPTIFFGCYHIFDYLRIFFHLGPKKVFWCGSDIKNLNEFALWFINDAEHVCENSVELYELTMRGIRGATIHPMLFDDPEKYQESYKHSPVTVVYMTYHKGREEEYGLPEFERLKSLVPGVHFAAYDGSLRQDVFDQITATHQAVIRFNEFDGFAETLAKGVLRGQYCFSRIRYPDIEPIDENIVERLTALKTRKLPKESPYWREALSNRLEI